MSARDSILARLRSARVTPVAQPDMSGKNTLEANEFDAPMLLERFATSARTTRTEVHFTSEAGWPDLLVDLAKAKKVDSLLLGTGTLHGALLRSIAPVSLSLRTYDRPVSDWKSELFTGVDAALTGARGGVAETGSVILWPDRQEPRLMSLVPPIHFVLLNAATIQPDLPSAMAAQGWSQGMPTNVLLVSGPSKTADIQQTLAYGAHGPRELIVLIVQEP